MKERERNFERRKDEDELNGASLSFEKKGRERERNVDIEGQKVGEPLSKPKMLLIVDSDEAFL